ncbi:MAG: zinc ABC transporter substrate-binding protein [Halanaerobacter sp.]
MNGKLKLATLALLILLVLTACQGSEEKNEELTVHTSIYPLYEVAKKVSGNNLNVKLVVPNGTELHSYRPTPKEISEVEKTDLFFYNGVGLEPWAEKIEDDLNDSEAKMVNISQHVNLIDYTKGHTINKESHDNKHTEKDKHRRYDPHLWLDPLNMKLIAKKMREEFSSLDPNNKEAYQKNYNKFAKKINKLDQKYESDLSNQDQNYILVSHAAFGYLAKRYGFKQLSVTGIAPHEEPSPGVLADLATQAKKYNLDYIFMETLASPKTVNILSQEADLEVLELNPVAGLTKEEQESGADYFALMYQNLDNIKKALVE